MEHWKKNEAFIRIGWKLVELTVETSIHKTRLESITIEFCILCLDNQTTITFVTPSETK